MTDIELCNLALARLAIDPISSFDDGTLESSTCKRLYPQKRDAYLESFYWWFAKAQAVLNTLVGEPLFGYTYSLQLPSDFIALRKVEGCSRFQLFGTKYLYTDIKGVEIIYTRRITEAAFPPLFTDALSYFLEVDLALPLTEKQERQDNAAKKFINANRLARGMNLQQDPGKLPTDFILASR